MRFIATRSTTHGTFNIVDKTTQNAIAYTPPASRRQLPVVVTDSTRLADEIQLFDPSIFTLPANAANRIRSFVKLFRLTVLDVASNTPLNTTASAQVPQSKSLRPSWQLWGSVEVLREVRGGGGGRREVLLHVRFALQLSFGFLHQVLGSFIAPGEKVCEQREKCRFRRRRFISPSPSSLRFHSTFSDRLRTS